LCRLGQETLKRPPAKNVLPVNQKALSNAELPGSFRVT
jgi:hypothetical protein